MGSVNLNNRTFQKKFVEELPVSFVEKMTTVKIALSIGAFVASTIMIATGLFMGLNLISLGLGLGLMGVGGGLLLGVGIGVIVMSVKQSSIKQQLLKKMLRKRRHRLQQDEFRKNKSQFAHLTNAAWKENWEVAMDPSYMEMVDNQIFSLIEPLTLEEHRNEEELLFTERLHLYNKTYISLSKEFEKKMDKCKEGLCHFESITALREANITTLRKKLEELQQGLSTTEQQSKKLECLLEKECKQKVIDTQKIKKLEDALKALQRSFLDLRKLSCPTDPSQAKDFLQVSQPESLDYIVALDDFSWIHHHQIPKITLEPPFHLEKELGL